MTQPDFGGEADQDRQPGLLPQDREDSPEREISERAREERDLELGYLDEDNEAHAAGQAAALGAERSSPRARTRGGDQTAAPGTRGLPAGSGRAAEGGCTAASPRLTPASGP